MYYSHTVAGAPLPAEKLAAIWDATRRVGHAREALDADRFLALLANDAVFELQDRIDAIVGKEAIADYITKRFTFIRGIRDKGGDTGRLIPATVGLPAAAEHPCLIFEIEGKRRSLWVVTVNAAGSVRRVDILTIAPRPEEATPVDQSQ